MLWARRTSNRSRKPRRLGYALDDTVREPALVLIVATGLILLAIVPQSELVSRVIVTEKRGREDLDRPYAPLAAAVVAVVVTGRGVFLFGFEFEFGLGERCDHLDPHRSAAPNRRASQEVDQRGAEQLAVYWYRLLLLLMMISIGHQRDDQPVQHRSRVRLGRLEAHVQRAAGKVRLAQLRRGRRRALLLLLLLVVVAARLGDEKRSDDEPETEGGGEKNV